MFYCVDCFGCNWLGVVGYREDVRLKQNLSNKTELCTFSCNFYIFLL